MQSNTPQPYNSGEIACMSTFGLVLNEDKEEPAYDLKEWVEMARLVATVEDRDRKLAIAEKALRFYANPRTYNVTQGEIQVHPIFIDDGVCARDALKEITTPPQE